MIARVLSVSGLTLFLALAGVCAEPAAEAPDTVKPVAIKPKALPAPADRSDLGSNAPEVSVIDAPTAAVLDYGGYSAQTRFYSQGGLLQYVGFGVYPRLNLGASLSVNGLIGNDRNVRARPPEVQVKFRFLDGDRYIPALAVGFDGQGFGYSSTEKRYHHRQRGCFVVGSQELGLPGLMAHPSVNISDFDSNSIFGSVPVAYNIRDKATILVEWDNLSNFGNSRFNSGLRVHLTPNFNIDFAVRGIGQGGWYPDGSPRGPERIVQLKYSGNF
jgi:hypothetical protein